MWRNSMYDPHPELSPGPYLIEVAVGHETPPGWRHSEFKGQETPLHVAFPG